MNEDLLCIYQMSGGYSSNRTQLQPQQLFQTELAGNLDNLDELNMWHPAAFQEPLIGLHPPTQVTTRGGVITAVHVPSTAIRAIWGVLSGLSTCVFFCSIFVSE